MTDSGYPRTVHEWRRGTPLSEATKVYEGEKSDVAVSGYAYLDRGHRYELRSRSITFYTSAYEVRRPDGSFSKVPVPEDADIETFADQVLVTLRTARESREMGRDGAPRCGREELRFRLGPVGPGVARARGGCSARGAARAVPRCGQRRGAAVAVGASLHPDGELLARGVLRRQVAPRAERAAGRRQREPLLALRSRRVVARADGPLRGVRRLLLLRRRRRGGRRGLDDDVELHAADRAVAG
mmetsp:Transcript_35814/g.119766  ORF Transcript_35814/g.119766 Transcript_35814/m.119766 type:complete len:242 (-) Transcript_35814:134-859(-)